MWDRRLFMITATSGLIPLRRAGARPVDDQATKSTDVVAPPTLSRIERCADWVSKLPRWPTEGDLSEAQWKKVADVASLCAEGGREFTVLGLAAYWARVHAACPDEYDRQDAEGKDSPARERDSPRKAYERCLLLTRVMFEIPESQKPVHYSDGGEMYAPRPCGGIDYRLAASTPEDLKAWVGLPVVWGAAKPRIAAYPNYEPPVGFSRPTTSEPQVEASLCWQLYPVRKGLLEFANAPPQTPK